MRGILKSVSGDVIGRRVPGLPLDGRVEVVLLLDSPSHSEVDRLKADCGRGYYVVTALGSPPVGHNTQMVLDDVARERWRQNRKWGVVSRNPLEWLAIVGEEYGEVAEHVTKGCVPPESDFNALGYRTELIHTAASCVSAVEDLDFGAAGL